MTGSPQDSVYLSFIIKATEEALDYVGQCVLVSLFVLIIDHVSSVLVLYACLNESLCVLKQQVLILLQCQRPEV